MQLFHVEIVLIKYQAKEILEFENEGK